MTSIMDTADTTGNYFILTKPQCPPSFTVPAPKRTRPRNYASHHHRGQGARLEPTHDGNGESVGRNLREVVEEGYESSEDRTVVDYISATWRPCFLLFYIIPSFLWGGLFPVSAEL